MACLPDKDKDSEDSSEGNGDSLADDYSGERRGGINTLASSKSIQVSIDTVGCVLCSVCVVGEFYISIMRCWAADLGRCVEFGS